MDTYDHSVPVLPLTTRGDRGWLGMAPASGRGLSVGLPASPWRPGVKCPQPCSPPSLRRPIASFLRRIESWANTPAFRTPPRAAAWTTATVFRRVGSGRPGYTASFTTWATSSAGRTSFVMLVFPQSPRYRNNDALRPSAVPRSTRCRTGACSPNGRHSPRSHLLAVIGVISHTSATVRVERKKVP